MRQKLNPVGFYERENEKIDQLVIELKSNPIKHIVIQQVAEALVNRTQGTVAVLQGAHVVTSDGNHVGYVSHVLAQSEENGPQHYLVATGLLLREEKLIPIEWVDCFGQNEIRLVAGLPATQELQPAMVSFENVKAQRAHSAL